MKRLLSLMLALLCLLAHPAHALAAEPSAPSAESSVSSLSTEIDRSQYVDGSAWENPAPDVGKIRVGLRYSYTAVVQAILNNPTGGAFDVGWYDDNLNFYPVERIYCSSVLIALADDEENGLMVLDAGTLEVLFLTFASRWIVVVPAEGEELGVTEYEGHQYHGGFMFLDAGFDLLTVVNVVDLETYVKGVVPYEMNRKFPVEALKAQAVAARTYVVYNMGAYSIYGFDLSDTAECQVYGGILAADEVTDGAVDATRGLLIRYRGEIADIYYSAADGGSTEDGFNVFNTDAPYLCGKRDPFEDTIDYPLKSWEVRYDGETIAGLLRDQWNLRTGKIQEVEPVYSENNNVIALNYTGSDGKVYHTEGRVCYTALGLNSAHFTVEKDSDGTFVFRGGGLGHNCGMSQWGAYAMAENFGLNYEDILRFYYTGVYIA